MQERTLSDIGMLMMTLVQALVDHPGEVVVNEIEGTQSTVIEVQVARSDHGKLIGRKGRTVAAIRELLVDMSGKRRRRFMLQILE